MSRFVFVDTGGWEAFFDRDDEHHAEAARIVRRLYERGVSLLTSDYVLDETLTLLKVRCGHTAAVTAGKRIQSASWVTLVDVGRVARDEAWKLFQKMKDQPFSFTDCTSFALMKRLGIAEALAFDADFERAGFTRLSMSHFGGR
jgi:hypothetical protein